MTSCMSDAEASKSLNGEQSHVDDTETGGGKYAPGKSTISSSHRRGRAGDFLAKSSNIEPPRVAKRTFDETAIGTNRFLITL